MIDASDAMIPAPKSATFAGASLLVILASILAYLGAAIFLSGATSSKKAKPSRFPPRYCHSFSTLRSPKNPCPLLINDHIQQLIIELRLNKHL
jgi:hypothetical protein